MARETEQGRRIRVREVAMQPVGTRRNGGSDRGAGAHAGAASLIFGDYVIAAVWSLAGRLLGASTSRTFIF